MKNVSGRALPVIALGIVAAVLAAALGYTYLSFSQALGERDREIGSLKTQIQDLSGERDRLRAWLEGNVSLYRAQVAALNQTLSDLQGKYTSLLTEYTSLKTSYGQIEDLNRTLADLQARYSRLLSDYNNLKASYDDLRSYASNLEARVKDLTDIVNMKKSKTIYRYPDSVTVKPNQSATITIDTPYAGYLYIDYWVIQGLLPCNQCKLYFVIKNDAFGGSYARYPLTDAAGSQGKLILPVLPGTTVLQIYYAYSPDGKEFTVYLNQVTYVY